MRPASEAELCEAVRGAEGPLAIRGGGTRAPGPVAGRGLDVSGITGIRLYEPGALTLVAAAGTPLAEIEAALAGEGQRLAFEPMDHRPLLGTDGTPTIGGVMAANVSGPRRLQAGAARDAAIGVRFVDGTGTAVANGGRVMKNVTGYDLVKLMAGSHGTLGVLTEVALKVLPAPEAMACLTIEGLDDSVALEALGRAVTSPFEVTGAAHLQRGPDGSPVTMIRLEGFEAQIAHRVPPLKDLLAGFGEVAVETGSELIADLWTQVRDVLGFAGRPGDVWRLSLRPSEAAWLVARVPEADAIYDWGGGRVWLLMPAGMDARAALGPFQGHATLIRAAPETLARLRPFAPENPVVARLSRGLRARFDPRGILNSGLMD